MTTDDTAKQPKIIVADTSPIITFVKGQCLDVLGNYYKEVFIPKEVYDEFYNKNFLDEKEYIDSFDFIKIIDLTEEERKRALELSKENENFHKGEASAIVICERDIKETLLIVDDRKAIRVASVLNINNIDAESLLEKFLSTNKIDKERFKGTFKN